MALATWWAGDHLPALAPLPGFRAASTTDIDALARLAALDGVPAGYGWVAGTGATIGELRVAFVLPRGDRSLWDFATLTA
jgi:hypothetical protein